MDWELLIPLLMFAFPVAVALLDKRAKKRRGTPQVQSRPIFPPAASGSDITGKQRAWAPDRDSDHPAIPLEGAQGVKDFGRFDRSAEGGYGFQDRLPQPSDLPQAEQKTPSAEPTAEGLRAISKGRHKDLEPGPEKEDPEQKLRIDKKKLILYSEILKPKFDA